MDREQIRVTFSHQYGFIAHAGWLPAEGISAPSINSLRNKVERARPRVSMEFTMVLDPAAKAKYGTQMAMRATNRKGAAPTLARRDGLRELGYMEGQNIAFEFRSAEGKL